MDNYRIAIQVDFYSQVHHIEVEASSKEVAIGKANSIAESWEGGSYDQINCSDADKILCIESTEVLDVE